MDEKNALENLVKLDSQTTEDNHVSKKPRNGIIRISNFTDNSEIKNLIPITLPNKFSAPQIKK